MQKIFNAAKGTAKKAENLVSCKAASKREQSDARISSAECEQTRSKVKSMRLAALAVMFICSTGYALADPGSSAITQAVGTFKGYIEPVRNLLYVLAAIVSLVGAFNCYYKLHVRKVLFTGHPDICLI